MFHPTFEDKKNIPITFETCYPNHSLLTVRVIEVRKQKVLGRTCIPFSAIRPGYRAMQMLDHRFQKMFGSFLLFNIGKRKLKVDDECDTKFHETERKMNDHALECLNKSLKDLDSLASKEIQGTIEVVVPDEYPRHKGNEDFEDLHDE